MLRGCTCPAARDRDRRSEPVVAAAGSKRQQEETPETERNPTTRAAPTSSLHLPSQARALLVCGRRGFRSEAAAPRAQKQTLTHAAISLRHPSVSARVPRPRAARRNRPSPRHHSARRTQAHHTPSQLASIPPLPLHIGSRKQNQ